jgi:hypothetical protein
MGCTKGQYLNLAVDYLDESMDIHSPWRRAFSVRNLK